MEFIAKTLYGLEGVLESELNHLNARNIRPLKRAVAFEGDLSMLYRANWHLRTALSVLKVIFRFRISEVDDLRRVATEMPWEDHLGLKQTFAIVPTVNSSLFNHTGYAALVLKDAVADRFRSKYGRRPSVNTEDPDILFNLHVREKEVTISVDSSVIPLFKRGYRKNSGMAPLNEALAAGIIMLTGWKGESVLLDPMCGSATIPIEAAMISKGIAPGSFRKFFGFMNWFDYNENLYNKIAAEQVISTGFTGPIIKCSDSSPGAVRMAKMNIANSGMDDLIKPSVKDFFSSDSGGKKFTIIMNPPYGERIKDRDIMELYGKIGERLKHGYPSSEAWILTSNFDALKNLGLRPSEKQTLYNGALECRLVKYDLYTGSMKGQYLR